MRSFSISLRLAIWYTCISFVGISLIGLVMWCALGSSVLAWKDRTIETRAARVKTLVGAYPQLTPDRLALRLDDLIGILPEGQLIQILDENGHRLFPTAAGSALPLSAPSCAQPSITNRMVGKEYFRVLCRPMRYDGRQAYLLVPSSLIEDRILSSILTTRLIQMASLLLVISTFGGYALSRRSLRPVDVLITEARAITAKDLSRRLPVPSADDELKRLAIEWNELLARIEVAVKRVEQFTADASHELRSPVAFIRATAQYNLSHGDLTNDTREALQAIVDETTETTALLENLLTLARADAAYDAPSRGEISLRQTILDVCERVRPSAEEKGLKLDLSQAKHNGDALLVHEADLRRLLGILLDNSIKYTPHGGLITISYTVRDALRVSVSDTGCGIAAEYQEKVFDRFFRVDAARTGNHEGAGLGLSIARCLVERHGGKIGLESQLGEGATVTFTLPASLLVSA